ncbi:helix-turn-helix transcriptional regulator [Segatella bryantii]|jgi:predicted DNA-binding transcriptional regulator YafY|uniref:helix-turn-helix transcriptional regulator n=1 Tax=Segatella bryantii TaxID=77095 RepID=UPI00241BF03E|nr:WYL domain-containing protein [Segatella bryantii]
MSTNKNALLRYQILDRCFSDFKRKYEIQDLVDAVNEVLYDMYGSEVSVRQIRDDIKYMRDRITYNAPIEAVPYDGKKCYYRYEDKNFSIFNNELSTEEVTTLRSTIEMLARFRDGSRNAWLEEVISNLEFRFGIKTNQEHIVSFEQNGQLRGLEFLSELIDCAINHQPLNLLYRTYNGKETTVVIHPYHVKQYNNRWFLFGLEQTPIGDRIANRPLDRIVKFSIANVPFIPNTTIDFTTYFDDVVGVSIPEDCVGKETVVLKFDPKRFPYAVSKPIHHSQKILSEKDCILQIEVRPNKELESVIFSYFPHVEVLAPASLREEFKEKIENNLKKYMTVQKDCSNKA